MRKLPILPIVIVFIFWAVKVAAQDDFLPRDSEKLIKKGALVGVKSTFKRGKGQIPAVYDSLKTSLFYIYAYRGAKVDVY